MSYDQQQQEPVYGIAIIGCGQIVTHHINAILGHGLDHHVHPHQQQQQEQPLNELRNTAMDHPTSSKRFRIVAVCDPSTERRATILQQITESTSHQQQPQENHAVIHQFATLPELLDYDDNQNDTDSFLLHQIDIMLIAVPHDLHELITLLALQSTQALHTTIVLEKPIAITKKSCQILQEASIQYQHRLYIAEQSPFWPAVVKTQQLIHDEHAIGSIISVASYYYESMRDNVTSGSVDTNTGNLGWRGSLQRAGGGIIIDGGLHWIRPIREITHLHIHKVIGVLCPIPSIQNALGMEGETLGHALFELQPPKDLLANPIIATYSACMLADPAPMAYDQCPYLRIIGTRGEIVIAGTGLQANTYNAGGVRLYNPQYPNGKEMLLLHDDDNSNSDGTDIFTEASRNISTNHPRTDFFMAFHGLWKEIYRIKLETDTIATQESVVRAIEDVQVVLAIYNSAQSKQWEVTGS
jgi:predicted dehydrogenase